MNAGTVNETDFGRLNRGFKPLNQHTDSGKVSVFRRDAVPSDPTKKNATKEYPRHGRETGGTAKNGLPR